MNEIVKALIQAGGAIGALGFIWLIIKTLMPAFKKGNGNGRQQQLDKSGEKPVEYWEKFFFERDRIFVNEVEKVIRLVMVGRNEELRKNVTEPIVETLKEMTREFQANRQVIVDKLDKALERRK